MKRRLLPLLVLGMVTVATAVAGCSGNGSATPPPTGASSTTASGSGGNRFATIPSTAPSVRTPLDASALVQSPCTALTGSDLSALHVVNPVSGPGVTAASRDCAWEGDSDVSVDIGWVTASKNGLTDLYTNVRELGAGYFVPTAVSGYPAVFSDPFSDGRKKGDCSINVGVSDHLYFSAGFTDASTGSRSCDFAAQAAQDVIKNLKGGGS